MWLYFHKLFFPFIQSKRGIQILTLKIKYPWINLYRSNLREWNLPSLGNLLLAAIAYVLIWLMLWFDLRALDFQKPLVYWNIFWKKYTQNYWVKVLKITDQYYLYCCHQSLSCRNLELIVSSIIFQNGVRHVLFLFFIVFFNFFTFSSF